MKRYSLLVILLLLISSLIYAQDESPFTLQTEEDTPAIEHTAVTRENRDYEYAEQYTDPGAVVFHDGQFHMFRNGFRGWPARVWIHYLVSDDGINWEQPSDQPVIVSEDVELTSLAALASSVYVTDDGTWVMHFYTWNSTSAQLANQQIGRATATDPAGDWVIDTDPVLDNGEDGTWNSDGVTAPTVIERADGDGFLMYYEGIDDAGIRALGVATSEDGIDWTPYENNPIMEVSADYEGDILTQPRVMVYDDQYVMLYRSIQRGDMGSIVLALATSEDGLEWERADNNPLAYAEDFGARAIWYTAALIQDDTLYTYLELMPGSNVTDIYVATAPMDTILGE